MIWTEKFSRVVKLKLKVLILKQKMMRFREMRRLVLKMKRIALFFMENLLQRGKKQERRKTS